MPEQSDDPSRHERLLDDIGFERHWIEKRRRWIDRRRWVKSSSSAGNGACVEVSLSDEDVLIRDSKFRRRPDAADLVEPIIAVERPTWASFLDQVIATGTTVDSELVASVHDDGGASLRTADGPVLDFTEGEWTAFCEGAALGEFN